MNKEMLKNHLQGVNKKITKQFVRIASIYPNLMCKTAGTCKVSHIAWQILVKILTTLWLQHLFLVYNVDKMYWNLVQQYSEKQNCLHL
jgi:hypothetical protein